MHSHTILMAGLLAAATVMPTGAQAQFSLDPRALLNRMTAPLRNMLPHPPARHRSANRGPSQTAAAARSRDEQEMSRLGAVGPRTWPSAYENVIGYTFWPNDYEAEYRQHGFGDIAAAILAPPQRGPALADVRRRPVTTGSAGAASADPDCDEARIRSDWPKADIEQTIDLSDGQRNALDRLQTTINNAAKGVRAGACRPTTATSPAERLETTVQRLWAVQNASVVIRGALKNFFDTLSDEQKAKFQIAPDKARAETKPDDNPMNRQACVQQAYDERLMKQIQQTVRPTPSQKASVAMLAKTASGMSRYLMASCAQPTPEDPLARLDAANARLTAINYAATSMEVALNQFLAALTDEQHKKFEALGR